MKYVLHLMGLGGEVIDPDPDLDEGQFQYLSAYDPNAHDGLGQADWTNLKSLAMTFGSPEEAWSLWRQQSTVRPLREDGKANRPLTAFNVVIEPYDG